MTKKKADAVVDRFVLSTRPAPTSRREASDRLIAAHWNMVDELNDMRLCALLLAPEEREGREALEHAYEIGLKVAVALLGVVNVDPCIHDMWTALAGGTPGDKDGDGIKVRHVAKCVSFALRLHDDPVWVGSRDPVAYLRPALHFIDEAFDTIPEADLAKILESGAAVSGMVAELLIAARALGTGPMPKRESERANYRRKVQQRVGSATKKPDHR